MKKIVSIILCVIMVAVCFTACSKSEAAKAVMEQIKAIGEITLENENVIIEAEKAYSLLSEEDKKDVKNHDDLVELRASFDRLQSYSDKADALLKTFDKIFTEYGISYSEVITPYDELTTAYSSSDEAVRAEYDKIFASVKEKYDEYCEVAKAATASAVAYINGFKEINKDKEITVKEIGCIAQISDGTTYYLFSMTYTDATGTDYSVYSTARFAGTPSVQSMLNYKDNFYAEASTSEKTNALKCGNILLDINEINKALEN